MLVLMSRPIIEKFLPASFPNLDYHLIFTQGKGEGKEGMYHSLSVNEFVGDCVDN